MITAKEMRHRAMLSQKNIDNTLANVDGILKEYADKGLFSAIVESKSKELANIVKTRLEPLGYDVSINRSESKDECSIMINW